MTETQAIFPQRCLWCGHEWNPRFPGRPRQCPKCRKLNFDEPPATEKGASALQAALNLIQFVGAGDLQAWLADRGTKLIRESVTEWKRERAENLVPAQPKGKRQRAPFKGKQKSKKVS